MRIKLLSLCVLMSIVLCFSGCATVFTGPRQQINIRTSSGQEAKATITTSEGTRDIILPTLLDTKRAKNPMVIDIKETNEYEKTTTLVPSKINPVFWVNIFAGSFSSTTDYASGSMWQYDDTVIVPVQKKSGK
ncbi:MAG: hypothetical protein AB7E39_06815 [Endomicrobiaceae bacterium]